MELSEGESTTPLRRGSLGFASGQDSHATPVAFELVVSWPLALFRSLTMIHRSLSLDIMLT